MCFLTHLCYSQGFFPSFLIVIPDGGVVEVGALQRTSCQTPPHPQRLPQTEGGFQSLVFAALIAHITAESFMNFLTVHGLIFVFPAGAPWVLVEMQ